MGTTVAIPDIPGNTLAVLRSRAAVEEMSVEAYVRRLVIEAAATPTVAEVLARSSDRTSGLSMSDIVSAVRENRGA